MSSRVTLAMLTLLLSAGCYEMHTRSASEDAGLDGGISCPGFAGYLTCGDLCPGRRCPRDEAYQCEDPYGVCIWNAPPDSRGSRACRLDPERPDRAPRRVFCANADAYCAVSPRHPFEAFPCLSAEYCRSASSAGLDATCIYSDHSAFVDGPPPMDSCPEGGSAQAGFCGGACGDCPWVPSPGMSGWTVSCTGVSERRGFGVCSFSISRGCTESDPFDLDGCAVRHGEPCVCLTLRNPDTGEEDPVGWPVFEASCLAYREHFPDDVVCHSPTTWEPL